MLEFLVSFLFAATLTGGSVVGHNQAAGAPALEVAVFPYAGVIPAQFANGRTVYVFRAWVTRPRSDGELVIVLHDERLLQAGMSEQLHARRGDLELRGAITIEAAGTVRCRATLHERGVATLASATHLVLEPRRGR